jgi:hypothetical protein
MPRPRTDDAGFDSITRPMTLVAPIRPMATLERIGIAVVLQTQSGEGDGELELHWV